ncbi:Glutathione S-transferase T3 [Linum grandiflorum]
MVRGANWSIEEDKILCKAYCKISEDGDGGTGQKLPMMWARVGEAYYVMSPSATPRPVSSMESRMGAIKKSCSSWKGILRKAQNLKTSGQTEDDVIEVAKELYIQENKKPFKDEHCWVILSRSPKWHMDTSFNMPHVRPMGGESSSFLGLDETNPDVEALTPPPLARPEGRDKQRSRNKGKVREDETGDLQGQTDALMSQSSVFQARNKDKALFERELIEHKKEKLAVTKEQWEYSKREKDLDMREREMALEDKKMAFQDKEMEILERDLSKLTPRKRKVLKNRQDAIYARHIHSGGASGVRDDSETDQASDGVHPIFDDTYRPLFH